jgi:uncharacterized protein (DUF362 family)
MGGGDVSKVAIVEFGEDVKTSLDEAVKLTGGIADLHTNERNIVVKVGVFDPKGETHTTISVLDAIINSFSKAPHVYVVESDNYRGSGNERLQIWKKLYSERVTPFNLSDDKNTKKVKIADEEIALSHLLFKPNVFVSTHVVRSFDVGSILKNLLGLIPDRKKARFHKKLETTLLDAYEAIGGIDLAVLDGTYLYTGAGTVPKAGVNSPRYRARTNTLIVGRDAVAVETVGAVLAGLNLEKVPVIQEAVRRGLGEGSLENIEIVGAPFERAKRNFASAITTLKKTRRGD